MGHVIEHYVEPGHADLLKSSHTYLRSLLLAFIAVNHPPHGEGVPLVTII
jgi:hypothetical protein